MKSKKHAFVTLIFIFCHWLTSHGQSYVVMLLNEKSGASIVLSKREIRDILTIDHRYLGKAQGINAKGIMASYQSLPADSIHSIVVKHENIGAKLALPFKVIGSGLIAGGAVLLFIGEPDTEDDNLVNNSNGNASATVGGVLLLGVGAGSLLIGKKVGDRPIEKEKTTYYFYQWTVKIVNKKYVKRFKDSIKK